MKREGLGKGRCERKERGKRGREGESHAFKSCQLESSDYILTVLFNIEVALVLRHLD